LNKDEIELKVLQKAELVRNQHSLAKEIGFSVGKINYVLRELIDRGLIKVENFSTKSKKQYRYLLTPSGIKTKIELTEKFIKRKKQECEELEKELEYYKKYKTGDIS
jgi:EPS-associated MarR family transcriptional regulator